MEAGTSDRCIFAVSENQQYDSGFPALLVLLIAFILVQLLLTAADIKTWLQLYNIKLYDRFSLFFFPQVNNSQKGKG